MSEDGELERLRQEVARLQAEVSEKDKLMRSTAMLQAQTIMFMCRHLEKAGVSFSDAALDEAEFLGNMMANGEGTLAGWLKAEFNTRALLQKRVASTSAGLCPHCQYFIEQARAAYQKCFEDAPAQVKEALAIMGNRVKEQQAEIEELKKKKSVFGGLFG